MFSPRPKLALLLPLLLLASTPAAPPPLDIGSRLELFVDDYLIEGMEGVQLKLHTPQPAGTALRFDRPWEGITSTFVTVFQDGDRFRMYYTGANGVNSFAPAMRRPGEVIHPEHRPVICYAESPDGIQWTRPSLKLFEFDGSKDNNIIWRDESRKNECMFVFRDDNPAAPASERYKALTGDNPPLVALVSADGLHWKEMQGQQPLFSQGLHRNAFDSLGAAFWDAGRREYVMIFRDADTGDHNERPTPAADAPAQAGDAHNYGNRSFKVTRSADFRSWSYPQWVSFGDAPAEHFYTSGATPYFRSPHLYLAFPMRLLDNWRIALEGWVWPGVSDAVFLSSRDGLNWDRRFMEAFVRPGRQERNWTDRSNMPAYGVIPTGPDEISLFVTRHFHTPSNHLERLALRTDGFVSVQAGYQGGELVTKPLIFQGDNLYLNYATSAAGSIRVEIQDPAGRALPGLSLEESELHFGDHIERPVRWTRLTPDAKMYPDYAKLMQEIGRKPLSRVAGKPVRLRFVLRDADLYSIQFR